LFVFLDVALLTIIDSTVCFFMQKRSRKHQLKPYIIYI